MSEKEPKKASEILGLQITGVENLLKDLKTQLSKISTEPEKLEPKGHKDMDEMLACPNCKPKLLEKLRPEIEKDLRPMIQKEFKEKLKSRELLTCDGCGEIVEKTESECPSCHGHKAH